MHIVFIPSICPAQKCACTMYITIWRITCHIGSLIGPFLKELTPFQIGFTQNCASMIIPYEYSHNIMEILSDYFWKNAKTLNYLAF
jgi:hypothetical protein